MRQDGRDRGRGDDEGPDDLQTREEYRQWMSCGEFDVCLKEMG